jgi:hypothetical protein
MFRHTHATLEGEEIGMALLDRQAQMARGEVRMTLLLYPFGSQPVA